MPTAHAPRVRLRSALRWCLRAGPDPVSVSAGTRRLRLDTNSRRQGEQQAMLGADVESTWWYLSGVSNVETTSGARPGSRETRAEHWDAPDARARGAAR